MFDSLEFVALAERLAQTDPSEAEYRTAIGRAYYGVFLVARTHEETRCGRKFAKTGSAHGDVKRSLEDFDAYISEDLDTLRKLRNRADYELEYRNAANDCHAALESARYILRKLM